MDLVVFAVCFVAVAGVLIFIICNVRKRSDSKVPGESGTAVAAVDAKPEKAKERREEKPQDGKDKRKRKRGMFRRSDVPETGDPLTLILGFDPYAQFDPSGLEISEEYHDSEQETEDMRALREKMRRAQESEAKIADYKSRRERINYELNKIARYLKDNRVVISSSAAVAEKIRTELEGLRADKRTAKQNRDKIEKLSRSLAETDETAENLKKTVDRRANDERMLKEASGYLAGEIARTERDLTLINSDIERLNVSVGAELKQIENDNRARVLMSKYGKLKPLLVAANTSYRAINSIDGKINALRAEKRDLRAKIEGLTGDIKAAYGARDTELTSDKICELNSRMLALDAEEDSLVRSREAKIREYQSDKRKANEFLDEEKYSYEDILIAEDKIVGELEYEQMRREYAERKDEAARRFAAAQSRYDTIVSRKVRFGKNSEDKKRAHEEEIQNALAELKSARTERDKTANDFDRVLPSISPASLVSSGSGVISRERAKLRSAASAPARQAATGTATAENTRLRTERRPRPDENVNLPARPIENMSLSQLLARLDRLERVAVELINRRNARAEEFAPGSPAEKIERRRAQVVAMRKNLKYVDSPQAAREFKQKLYRLSLSLDEDEMADNVLSEMIKRTMNEATRLGERSGGSYRGPYDDGPRKY